jgi:hypothetical protein
MIHGEPSTEAGVYTLLAMWLKKTYPDLIWFFDLSGVRVHEGTKPMMAYMRSKTGIPDLIILEPRKGYFGLMLEIKRKASPVYQQNGNLYKDHHLEQQALMLDRLRQMWYYADFAVGLEDAQNKIMEYLK